MDEIIFDEAEVKVELVELSQSPRSEDDENVDTETGKEPLENESMEVDLSSMYPEFRHHENENVEEESADEILGDLNNDDTAEEWSASEIIESSSSSSEESEQENDVGELFVEDLTAEDLGYPHILNEGPPKILPEKLVEAYDSFRTEVGKSGGAVVNYSELSPKEKKVADRAIKKWVKEAPEIEDDVEDQLKTELLAFSLVNCAFRTDQSVENEEEDSDEESRPALFKKLGLLSELFTKRNQDENLMTKFVEALGQHECFQKYHSYLDSLTEEQLSTLVWDCSIQTQRVIVRLTKMHELVLSAVDKLAKISREASRCSQKEMEVLAAATRREAEGNILTLDTSELSTKGRKSLVRGFAAPYFKSEDGFAAPYWNPYPLPYKYDQLRVAPITDSELEMLQVSILKAAVEAKKFAIQDRCSQLLLRSGRDGVVEQRLNLKCPYELQVLCAAEDLLRWKEQSIEQAEKTTFEDIAADTQLRINWFSVAEKVSKHASRYYLPDECERLWDKIVRPRILRNKQMSIEEVQKLMELVNKYGNQKWTVISKEMGYSAYQCFTAYEAFREGEMGDEERSIRKQADLQSGLNKFYKMVKAKKEFQPHTSKDKYISLGCKMAQFMADMPNLPLQTLAEHYNRFCIRPDPRGHFKLVEDILLLVCMVKMREYLKVARTFTPVKDYLPWRFVSTWTCRADLIFGPRTAFWTRAEDLKLLELVKSDEKTNWSGVAKKFASDKNRKNVRRRYLYLMEALKFDTFENFRQYYESRNAQPLYTSFGEYLPPLHNALNQPQREPPSYEALCDAPQEVLLWRYLESFDKWVLQETINDLETVMAISVEKEGPPPMLEDPCPTGRKPIIKPNTDRRKFFRGDPASTGSAIHLRKLKLKPPHLVQPLTEFEDRVYDYFYYFDKKLAKTVTKHKYLPTAKDLCSMPEIRRILVVPADIEEQCDMKADTLDDKGYPVLEETVKTKAPRKARSRRGIALRNLRMAHTRRRQGKQEIEPEQGDPEGPEMDADDDEGPYGDNNSEQGGQPGTIGECDKTETHEGEDMIS